MLEQILSTSIKFEIDVGIAIAVLAFILVAIGSFVLNKFLTKEMEKKQRRHFQTVAWFLVIGSILLGIALKWAAVAVS